MPLVVDQKDSSKHPYFTEIVDAGPLDCCSELLRSIAPPWPEAKPTVPTALGNWHYRDPNMDY